MEGLFSNLPIRQLNMQAQKTLFLMIAAQEVREETDKSVEREPRLKI